MLGFKYGIYEFGSQRVTGFLYLFMYLADFKLFTTLSSQFSAPTQYYYRHSILGEGFKMAEVLFTR